MVGKFPTQGLHTAIFNSFKYFDSGYKMILIYHVISKERVFKEFCGFIGGSLSY